MLTARVSIVLVSPLHLASLDWPCRIAIATTPMHLVKSKRRERYRSMEKYLVPEGLCTAFEVSVNAQPNSVLQEHGD